MPVHSCRPSDAWLNDVFRSPPRRDIPRLSKTTTRVPVQVPLLNQVFYGEGGNEATALLLCKHLHRNGLVLRFKPQPFALEEIKGPKGRIPDLLVQLDSEPSLHIIQCKAKRFVTPEVQARYDEEKAVLEPNGFQFHSWTDRDKLSNPTSQSVRLLDRGFQNVLTHARLREITDAAKTATLLGQLLELFGWDDAIAAAAQGAFHLNVTEKIHEKSPVLHHFPRQTYQLLFAHRPVLRGFWDTLAS